jgi:pimeloyl-ACP methyl ester carboxylesterase
MTRRRLVTFTVAIFLIVVGIYVATPYVRAASLIVRGADLGGQAERLAEMQAYDVEKRPRHRVPTRHGEVTAQFYMPDTAATRTILLVPGIHALGIDEPRLMKLAADLAAAGVNVMTMALPDLQRYTITPRATDVIEDTVSWMASRRDLAPDGRVGVAGISFAGGLSVSAASRPAVRDKLAFVFSFGGHGDMPRVMRYLATGEALQLPGIEVHAPHDYSLAVVLHGLADRGVVPADQVPPLRSALETFLTASQQTVFDNDLANATFAKAREMATTLPEPSRTLMNYVNDRAVAKLGPALVPYLDQSGADDPAMSPERSVQVPSAPVFLLHGEEDTVIPPTESVVLADYLRMRGADVRLMLTSLITHAQLNESVPATEVLKLVGFWADLLRQ